MDTQQAVLDHPIPGYQGSGTDREDRGGTYGNGRNLQDSF